MNQRTIMWTFLLVMFLTLPSMLFLVVAVMFVPAIFYVAAILYMISKMPGSSSIGELLTFMLFCGLHIVVYFVIYWIIAAILAKLVSLIPNVIARYVCVFMICAAMTIPMFFPVYGGGGHSGMQWETFGGLVNELERDYGSGATLSVYGGTLILISAIVGFRYWRRRQHAAP